VYQHRRRPPGPGRFAPPAPTTSTRPPRRSGPCAVTSVTSLWFAGPAAGSAAN